MVINKKIFAAVFLSLLILSPLVTYAEDGMGLKADAKVDANSAKLGISINANFCTNLPTYTTNLNNKFATAQTNLTAEQQTIMTDAQNRQATRAKDLANTRAQGDADRAALYAKLGADATTTAQSQAVASFKATIEADVTVRRSAVDAAIAAYWTGLFNVLQTRQAAVQTARQNYASVLQTALTAASTSCANGTAPTTVRSTFAVALKTAASQFATDRKAVDKSGPQIKALAQTRNQAISAAFATFKTEAQAAGVTLKAAFSVSASS